ncbi:MAG TPA: hypothetical protein VF669_03495 [Tepidisphaeraceae bacterium]
MLLVVLSLLQTAAVVVYVNKEDFNRNALNETRESLQSKTSELESARQSLMAAQQSLTTLQQEANSRATKADTLITGAQQQVANLNVQLAQASSEKAAQQLDIARLTEGLRASQDTTSRLSEEVARLRTGNDQLVKQSSDLNSAVSDLSNRLDVTERERKFLAEQLTEAQTQTQKLGSQLKNMGASPDQAVAANAGTAANRSGPPIAGTVREVKDIAGMKYATISVGSADQVAPGMEFKIINKNTNDYLGSLVVDSVTPNESTGKITGPHVDQIRQGVEARTQL